MSIPFRAFPTFLLAAFALCAAAAHAQDAQDNPKPAVAEPAPPKGAAIQSEPLKITITFKATDGGKTTTQRSYTVISTSDKRPSQIRDSSRIPVATGAGSTQYSYQDIRTDVDINELKKVSDSVYLVLRIDTEDFANSSALSGAAFAPIKHSHTYTVTPSLDLGKLTTVYSSVDAVNNTSVDVQVLVSVAEGASPAKRR